MSLRDYSGDSSSLKIYQSESHQGKYWEDGEFPSEIFYEQTELGSKSFKILYTSDKIKT